MSGIEHGVWKLLTDYKNPRVTLKTNQVVSKQDTKYTYDVALRRVRVTVVVEEEQ